MWGEVAAMGVNAGLGVYNSIQNQRMQRETNALNYQMFKEAQDYDKPVNQVARLKEAGLNPALMYGTGSGANVAPSRPTMEAPRSELPGLDPGAMVAIQQSRLIGQQAALAAEQTKAAKRENKVLDASPGSLKTDSALWRFGRSIWDKMKRASSDPSMNLGRGAWSGAGKMDIMTRPEWMKRQFNRSYAPRLERVGSKF